MTYLGLSQDKIYKALAFLILSISSLSSFAQSSVVNNDSTIAKTIKKVILVPFKPMDYVSDADQDIGMRNSISPNHVGPVFRMSIDQIIYKNLLAKHNIVQLSQDSPVSNIEDLKNLYNSISSVVSKRIIPEAPNPYAKEQAWESSLKFIFKDVKKKQEKTEIKDGKVKVYNEDIKYYKTVIDNPNILPYLAEKHTATHFLFINLMEIKTRYENCLDLQNKVYEREFTVHYTLYNAEGKAMIGNLITVLFPSSSNNINDIIEKNFGMLAKEIVATIP